MKTFGINEAKTHFSRLLRRVAAGEEVMIARGGTPVARLVPVVRSQPRQIGIDVGKVTVPEDFNRPLAEDRSEPIIE